jgi:hypothetical protein
VREEEKEGDFFAQTRRTEREEEGDILTQTLRRV